MEQKLKKYLKKYNIKYKIHEHQAVFTVEESKKVKMNYTGMHTKSLFLKSEEGDFYLICMSAEKRLNLKFLRKYLKTKKLHFASEKELKLILNLSPGSVSIFGLINDSKKQVNLILDKEVWNAEIVGFHPNINTETLELSHEDLVNFYNSSENKKEILILEDE